MYEGRQKDDPRLIEPKAIELPHSLKIPRKPAPAPEFRPCRA